MRACLLPAILMACGTTAPEPCAPVDPYGADRLTHTQVGYALQDVFGVSPTIAEALPVSSGEAGFDVTAAAGQIDPTWLGQLLSVARRAGSATVTPARQTWEAADLGFEGRPFTTATGDATRWTFLARDTRASWTVTVDTAGTYALDVRGALFTIWEFDDVTQFPDGTPPSLTLQQGGQTVGSLSFANLDREAAPQRITLDLPAGSTTLTAVVSIDDDFHLLLGDLRLEAPLQLPCALTDETCIPSWTAAAAHRLFRRPVLTEELSQLLAVGADETTPEARLNAIVQALVVDPNFIVRPPHSRAYDVASRLALALWASVPDETLLACAARGHLLDQPGDCGLPSQIDRMLDDPRGDRMLADFARQWLGLTELDEATREQPGFDEDLRHAMVQEVVGILRLAIREDLPVSALLDADWTWVDGRLAAWYGLDLPADAEGQRVDAGDQRGGLLRSAAFTTAHAVPSRTSPVLRGVAVLNAFLCDPPGGKPDDVPELPDDGASAIDALTAHSAQPGCAFCHEDIDPLGLALESYDQSGAWRGPTSPTTLPDGTTLDGASGLSAWLATHPDVRSCISTHLATYTRGRVPTGIDRCEAEEAAGETGLRGMLRSLLTAPGFTP